MNRVKTHAPLAKLPVIEFKPGSQVVVSNGMLTEHPHVAFAPSERCEVVSNRHTAQGMVTLLVRSKHASHPSGILQLTVSADSKCYGKRVL